MDFKNALTAMIESAPHPSDFDEYAEFVQTMASSFENMSDIPKKAQSFVDGLKEIDQCMRTIGEFESIEQNEPGHELTQKDLDRAFPQLDFVLEACERLVATTRDNKSLKSLADAIYSSFSSGIPATKETLQQMLLISEQHSGIEITTEDLGDLDDNDECCGDGDSPCCSFEKG